MAGTPSLLVQLVVDLADVPDDDRDQTPVGRARAALARCSARTIALGSRLDGLAASLRVLPQRAASTATLEGPCSQ